MFQSLKYSNIILRISLAIVFFWFGIDKFFHPDYWVHAWVPQSVIFFAESLKLRAVDIVYLSGVFEILLGESYNFSVAFFFMILVWFYLLFNLRYLSNPRSFAIICIIILINKYNEIKENFSKNRRLWL